MYVPKGVYERAPFFWILLSILLIVMGTYLGATGKSDYFMFGIGGGLIACIWGLRVTRQRLARKDRKICSTYDEYLTETTELHVDDIHRQRESA